MPSAVKRAARYGSITPNRDAISVFMNEKNPPAGGRQGGLIIRKPDGADIVFCGGFVKRVRHEVEHADAKQITQC